MATSQRFAVFGLKKPSSKAMAAYLYLLGVLAAFVAAGVLVAAEAKPLVAKAVNQHALQTSAAMATKAGTPYRLAHNTVISTMH